MNNNVSIEVGIDMAKSQRFIVLISFILLFSGCVSTSDRRPSLYQQWGKQINELPVHNGRNEDVSMLLGVAPTKCEDVTIERPKIGIIYGKEKPIVISVRPNGPAQKAGIIKGDIIRQINNSVIYTPADIQAALQQHARVGNKLSISTNRQTYIRCRPWRARCRPIVPSSPGTWRSAIVVRVAPWTQGSSGHEGRRQAESDSAWTPDRDGLIGSRVSGERDGS